MSDSQQRTPAERRRESASERAWSYAYIGGAILLVGPSHWAVLVLGFVLLVFGLGLIVYAYTPTPSGSDETSSALRALAAELGARYRAQRSRQHRILAVVLLAFTCGVVLILGDSLDGVGLWHVRDGAVSRAVG